MNKYEFKEEQKKLILQSFALYDLDNDGKLSAKQTTNLVKNMLALSSDTSILRLLAEVDPQQRGYLRKQQFLTLMSKLMMTITSQKDMQQSYKVFLSSGQKSLTHKSITKAFEWAGVHIQEQQIKILMQQLNQKGDGKASYQQFKSLMTK